MLDVIYWMYKWLGERILGCKYIMECKSAYTNYSSTDRVRLLTLGKTLILDSDKPKPSANMKRTKTLPSRETT